MLNPFRKVVTLLLTIALLVGVALPQSVFAFVEPNTIIPDGEYEVTFQYLRDGTASESAADSFMEKEGAKLIIRGGKAVFEHKVEKATYVTFAYLAARKPGAAKAVIATVNNETVITGQEGYEPITVRDDETGNHVIVQIAIEDIWKKQDVLMHIHDQEDSFNLGSVYNHWYNAQLQVNTSDMILPEGPGGGNEGNDDTDITTELFQQRIAEGYELHEAAIEGNYDGTYPVGSKQTLLNKLQLAEGLVAEAVGNVDILEAAYKIADQAIKNLQASKIVVDKSRLIGWISTATAWIEGKGDAGERESGKPANILTTPVSDGEYLPQTYYGSSVGYKGPITDIKAKIAEAQLVVDDELATQAQVTTMYNNANALGDWELYDRQRLAAYDIEILLLDSLEKDAQISSHAGDISPHAVLLQQAGPGYYRAFANFALYDTDNVLTDASIRRISASGGLFGSSWSSGFAPAVKNIDVSNTPAFNAELEGEHAETIKVYQIPTIRGVNVTDDVWQGLWKIQYPLELPEAERKTVYISFNKAYLEALQQLIDDAEVLLDNAEQGIEVGKHSAYYIDLLEDAIDAAQEIADQLSAPRPTIVQATTALQDAVDAFVAAETKLLYFSAIDGSEAVFSPINEYLVKPALVVTDDEGGLHVKFTIKDSSKLAELKVKSGDQFIAATVVSKDDNTRIITFQVDSLSQLLDAQVSVVDAGETIDQEIRLNFNNVDNQQLYDLIKSATSTYEKAVNSGQSNQNATISINALSNAIALANEEAARIPSHKVTTDEAYTRLTTALSTFNETYNSGNGNTGSNPTTPNPSDPVYPANGNYYVPFTIYKYGTTAQSVAHDYVVSEALVKVSGNTKTVMFTVLQSKEITGLKLNGSSGQVVKRDSAKNQRVMSFTLNDLSSTLDGWVKIDWAAVKYHHEYDIQFKFEEGSAVYAGSNAEVPGSDHVPGAPDLPNPDGDLVPEEQQDGEGGKGDNDAGESAGNEPVTGGEKIVRFNDTESHWAKASIAKAVGLGIVTGYEDGSFRPNAIVTRGEFAVMISRALKLDGSGAATGLSDAGSFPGWAQEHVGRVVAAGIIQGYGDGSFRAEGELTRAQLAVIVARALKLKLEEQATLTFTDAEDIPSWARKEVAAAVQAGLLTGKGNNIFDANGTATRAEALTLIIRLLERQSK